MRRELARVVSIALPIALTVVTPAAAQRVASNDWSSCRAATRQGATSRALEHAYSCASWTPTLSRDSAPASKPRSAWTILASALLPGSGQAALRQWRAIPYLALESYAWGEYAHDSHGARRDRDSYRLLAASVARLAFNGAKPIGDFEYYERMENYLESGRFDVGPGTNIVPEGDTTTFNGAMWLLARRTYWKDVSDPPPRGSIEWTRAESFYLNRAIRPEFQWSWKGAPIAFDQYRRFIRQANQGYRDAVTDLGIVIGNHFLSTVDAYVSVQVRRRKTLAGRGYELSIGIPF